MKTAKIVAEALYNDGQVFETEDGRSLDEIALEHDATKECARRTLDGELIYHPCADYTSQSMTRYVFPDGSAIVVAGDAWDLEGDEPFSWEGA